jgi:hypothetical protein
VDSSPCDYHLFPVLKQGLGRQKFEFGRMVETVKVK